MTQSNFYNNRFKLFLRFTSYLESRKSSQGMKRHVQRRERVSERGGRRREAKIEGSGGLEKRSKLRRPENQAVLKEVKGREIEVRWLIEEKERKGAAHLPLKFLSVSSHF